MSTAAPLQSTAAKSSLVSKSSHAGLSLQRKCACGGSASSSLTGECEECNKKRLQKKLRIGASNDPLEQEADRVADQVLAAPLYTSVSSAALRIQRFTEQATADAAMAPPSVDRVLSSSGRPLEPALKQEMGQRFGYDFSQVRVHSGGAAEQSAQHVNAHAYTVGHNVVFGAGRFAPGTHEGRLLLAHELTHVVQQMGAEGGSGRLGLRGGQMGPEFFEFESTHIVQQGQTGAGSSLLLQRQPTPTAKRQGKILSLKEISADPKREKTRKKTGQTAAKVCRSISAGAGKKNCPTTLEPGLQVTIVAEKAGGAWLQILTPEQIPEFGPDEPLYVMASFIEELPAGIAVPAQVPDETAFGLVTWSGGDVSVMWLDDPPKSDVPDQMRIQELIYINVINRHLEGEPADDSQLMIFERTPGEQRWFLSWSTNWTSWQPREGSSEEEVPGGETADVMEECDESDVQCLKEQRTDIYQNAIKEAGEAAATAAELTFPVQSTLFGPESESGGDTGVLAKLPKVGRIIDLVKKGSRARSIKRPKVLEALRRAGSTEKLDDRIMDAALAYRSGSGSAQFGRNFGAARVRLEDGTTKIITAVNVPKGTHSEEEILGVIHAIQAEGHDLSKVKVEQIFSERIPCPTCMNEVIKKHMGQEVDVFYFLGVSEGRFSRGRKLRKLYY